MSAVSGIGGSSNTLEMLLESMKRTSRKSATSEASGTTSASDTFALTLQAATPSAGSTASTDETSLKEKIDAAVKAAIANFDTSTGSTNELLATIRKTVDETLRANGVEPRERGGSGAMGAKEPPSGPPPSGPPPTGPPPAGGDGTSSSLAELLGNDSDSEDGTISASDLKDALLELLESDDASSTSGTGNASSTDFGSVLRRLLGALPNGAQVDTRA